MVFYKSTVYVILVDDNRQLECNNLCSIAVFPITGHVYIADHNNHHIQVLNPDTFSHIYGIAILKDIAVTNKG